MYKWIAGKDQNCKARNSREVLYRVEWLVFALVASLFMNLLALWAKM